MNRSIDYSKCEYLPEKKKYSNSNENILLSRKTDETIWNPLPSPISKRTPHPPTPLSTNAAISEQFFMTTLFVQILKTTLTNFRGGGNYGRGCIFVKTYF